MKKIKLSFIALAIALFAIACGDSAGTNQTANTGGGGGGGGTQPTPTASPTATAKPDDLADAKTTYMQICANCHQEKGEGGTVKLEGKRIKVPSLLEGHGLEHSDAEFAKQIANGGDGMPAFKDRLKPEQIDALVKFIRRDIQAGLKIKTSGH